MSIEYPQLPTGVWRRDGNAIKVDDETILVAVARRAEARDALAVVLVRLPDILATTETLWERIDAQAEQIRQQTEYIDRLTSAKDTLTDVKAVQ